MHPRLHHHRHHRFLLPEPQKGRDEYGGGWGQWRWGRYGDSGGRNDFGGGGDADDGCGEVGDEMMGVCVSRASMVVICIY